MFYRSVVFVVLLCHSISVWAQSPVRFTPDSSVDKVAEAFAKDCANFVKGRFKLELDGSDISVIALEPILDNLSMFVKSQGMEKERIEIFAKMFGFYIGETYRKNHGGVNWGMVTINKHDYYALGKMKTKEPVIWPIDYVSKRIQVGKEANIANYYMTLINQ